MNWNPCEGATLEARTLYAYMSDLSEENWAAGWMMGTEAACWEAVRDGGKSWGMGSISPEQAADLKQLSDAAGGWWHWPAEGHDPAFVGIPEWEAIYADRWGKQDAEEAPS